MDVAVLPYRAEIISFLIGQREQGRADRLGHGCRQTPWPKRSLSISGIFDCVYATQGGQNLRGKAKAALLREEFGEVRLRIHRRFAGGSAGLEGQPRGVRGWQPDGWCAKREPSLTWKAFLTASPLLCKLG